MPDEDANPFFTAHAQAYAESLSFARGADLGLLLADLRVRPGERAVDVATGTGHTALALAAAGLSVVGVDPTPAMLDQARRLAAEQGSAAALRWLVAEVDAMPLEDGAFDVVACRRAFHHFPDPGHALGEMARLLARGGRLGVSDMCPAAPAADVANALERLRDATHRTALTEDAWRRLLDGAGLAVRSWRVWDEPGTFAQWITPVADDGVEAAAIREGLAAAPAEARRILTGGRPDGWVKRRIVFVAERG